MQPMLEADRLTKRYEDGVLALDDVSFRVGRGEIYAMLGGNGAGKSTAIHLFLDFIPPTDGEARVDGIPCHRRPLEAKTRVAYVSENVALYPDFTAVQNLEYFTRLAGRRIDRQGYREALERVGLQGEAHDKKLRGFSKGMRQKTALAIAVLKDAPAILLDEPTSGLDPQAGLELTRLLGDLRDEGKAILMSTHDIFRAKQIADRVGIMNRGRLVMEKEREELADVDLEALYVRYMLGDASDGGGSSPSVAGAGEPTCSA